jgi:hypothetical protein
MEQRSFWKPRLKRVTTVSRGWAVSWLISAAVRPSMLGRKTASRSFWRSVPRSVSTSVEVPQFMRGSGREGFVETGGFERHDLGALIAVNDEILDGG